MYFQPGRRSNTIAQAERYFSKSYYLNKYLIVKNGIRVGCTTMNDGSVAFAKCSNNQCIMADEDRTPWLTDDVKDEIRIDYTYGC